MSNYNPFTAVSVQVVDREFFTRRRGERGVGDADVLVEGVGGIKVRARVGGRRQPVTVASTSRDTAPRSVHPHGLKIAVARRLRLGLGALLIAERIVGVGVGVCVVSHERVRTSEMRL